ncbi:hypothetical protein DOY81_009037 [Sarcophaga bullata]|nr:hypothetical protein DOY81_009037 [Sarcophaga bullata]
MNFIYEGSPKMSQTKMRHFLKIKQKQWPLAIIDGTGINHSACAAHCLLRGNRGLLQWQRCLRMPQLRNLI